MKPPHIPYNPLGNLDTMELQVEKNTEIETEAWFIQGLLGEPEAVLPCGCGSLLQEPAPWVCEDDESS